MTDKGSMGEQLEDRPPPPGEDGALVAKTMAGAAWLLTWKMVARSIGFVSTLVLARVLVPGDFGVLAMAGTFAAAVDALSQLGLQDALVRHVGNDRRLFNTAFTLQVGRAIIISTFVAGMAPVAVWWFSEPRLAPILFVLAGSSLLGGIENIGLVEFRRAMRFDVQFKLLLTARLVQIATTIPLALLLRSYWALLFGIVASQAARVIMGYVLHPFRPRFRISGWRELAGFSFWTWAAASASVVWDRADPFVLGPVIGSAQLGLYLIATDLAILPVTEIISPVADALFAGFASAQKKGGSSIHHAPLVAVTLMMFLMPITITISCGSGYVVEALLGPKWESARVLVAIIAWLCLFSPFSFVSSVVLVANGFVRRNFAGKVIASSVKLAVMLTTIAFTDNLRLIAVAVTVCVAAESCAYSLLLRGLGDIRPKSIVGPIMRTMIAGSSVVLLLYETGLAWQPVSMPSLDALLHGAALGAAVATLYAAVMAGLWHLSGRPAGPETQLLNLVSSYIRPLFWRVTRRVFH